MNVPKPVAAVFILLNLLLLAACLFALRQNVKLRGNVANLVALLTPANGSRVPPLVGEDSMGASQTITYGQDPRPTLVYTFSKGCRYCKENWRAIRSLQSLAPRQLRIVYIDTQLDIFDLKYLATNGIGQSLLLVELYPTVAYAYDARLMPQILLVDANGRVQWSHVGELAPSDVSQALSLIKHD
jgi:hypothetical protein